MAHKVLVVDGMITNKTDAYHVFITYARPFNSADKGSKVSGANVYVTDNLGNSYSFKEREKGDYASDSLQFTGLPWQIYRLHIVTADGLVYESDPQRLLPELNPDSVYAEFDSKQILEKVTGLKVDTHGADILIDFHNQSDTLPRYRLMANLVLQHYDYALVQKNWNDPCIHFDIYCWNTVNPNSSFNLSDKEYIIGSAYVKKHEVCFLDDNFDVLAPTYGFKVNWEDTTGIVIKGGVQFQSIHHRILYLNLYTLNKETDLYYKSLNEQILSENKIFDPIATQLNGNIKCISDPGTGAIGFFQASSVSNSAYIVYLRTLKNGQPTLIKTPYILPPELSGCRIDRLGSRYHNVPSFWIFI
jgi:hypothetical protein